MGSSYNDYIKNHKDNVYKGFQWLIKHLPDTFQNEEITIKVEQNIKYHDESKFSEEEYEAYDNYFYGSAVPDPDIVYEFNKAWLHHIHNNPHHWQYWVLINDEPKEGETYLEIPDEYIIEMICDWWSFSWKLNKLNEIFDWYDEHKTQIRMHHNSREKIEKILNKMKLVLETMDSKFWTI